MTPSTTLTWSTREFPAPTSPSSTTPPPSSTPPLLPTMLSTTLLLLSTLPLSLTTPSTTLVWTRSYIQFIDAVSNQKLNFYPIHHNSWQHCSCQVSFVHHRAGFLNFTILSSSCPRCPGRPPRRRSIRPRCPRCPCCLPRCSPRRCPGISFGRSSPLVLWRPTMRQHWSIGNVRNYLFLFMK